MAGGKLLLIGAGGHCRSVLDSIDRTGYESIGIIDLPHMVGKEISGIPVIGTDADSSSLYDKGYRQVVITLGSVGNCEMRMKTYNLLKGIGFSFPSVIDPSAIVSGNCVIGEGTFVGKGAMINTDVTLGNCCIVNTGAILDHDCCIGDFVHLAPGTRLSGDVSIGDNTHVGIGSSIIQSIKIGHDTIIGAGSVVVSDIPDNVTAFGVPCKIYHKNEDANK